MFKSILAAAALASGVATGGGVEEAASAADDQYERRQHVRRTIPIFEDQQASRRSIRNGIDYKGPLNIFGGVSTSRYGMLRVERVNVDVVPRGNRHQYLPASQDRDDVLPRHRKKWRPLPRVARGYGLALRRQFLGHDGLAGRFSPREGSSSSVQLGRRMRLRPRRTASVRA